VGETVIRILALSDEVVESVYSPRVRDAFGHIDLVLGCGDLPAYYLDYVASTLNVPFYHVPGNHDLPPAPQPGRILIPPEEDCASSDIDGRVVRESGLILAGLGGSIRYRPDGLNQYTQAEMRWRTLRLGPRLAWNRWRHGRGVDILVTHAPPRNVHDGADPAHVGFDAFHDFIRYFRPRYLLHGHSHVWRRDTVVTTQVGPTRVLNVCPYRVLTVEPAHGG
jgi:Icc-related predicted phosphoesterase